MIHGTACGILNGYIYFHIMCCQRLGILNNLIAERQTYCISAIKIAVKQICSPPPTSRCTVVNNHRDDLVCKTWRTKCEERIVFAFALHMRAYFEPSGHRVGLGGRVTWKTSPFIHKSSRIMFVTWTPLIYEWSGQIYPTLYNKIKANLRNGRFPLPTKPTRPSQIKLDHPFFPDQSRPHA